MKKILSQTRRGLLLAGAMSIASGSAKGGSLATRGREYLLDPANLLSSYARIRANGINGSPALWWISAIVYAKQYNELARPLFGVIGVSLNQISLGRPSGISQNMEEAGYFTDLESGKIISEWKNPYTGGLTKPEPYKMSIKQDVGIDGNISRPVKIPGMEIIGRIGPIEIFEDFVWVDENSSARVDLLSPSMDGRAEERAPGESRVIDSLARFQANIRDLSGPNDSFIPATLSYQETDPWWPWMKMGDLPGLQLWQLKGVKISDPELIPRPLRKRLRSDYPGFI